MALARAVPVPVVADRPVRARATPAPTVSAANSASRRFIRLWVIFTPSGSSSQNQSYTGCRACCPLGLSVMLALMICLPQPDAAIIARKAAILAGLRTILGPEDVIDDDLLVRAYETDALTAYRQRPLAVVLPDD